MKKVYFFVWMIVGALFVNDSGIAKEISLTSQWHLYHNSRFHYQICCPLMMIPQGESDNGDGQLFTAKDGASIRVYGSYRLDQDFKKIVTEISQWMVGGKGRITYRSYHPQWAVVSGYDKEGKIFYTKLLKGTEDRIMVVVLTYSAKLKFIYNPLSATIASCLKNTE
ncbi:unnamed protein product [Commensalibacter communis]|uniref:hypothetical protein n=1 Tax=Commensalibacter communis TaxID=2972786 RepID=UPI0022FFADB2|nr:hypothetical protein [Commensalibacter communis]CAI3948852.1 unnamed protein product [Commensalibacter communis]CAI3953147.1 unnamed protein product [Commensalibacter communis]